MPDDDTYARFEARRRRSWGGTTWFYVVDKAQRGPLGARTVSEHKSQAAAEKALERAVRLAEQAGEPTRLPKVTTEQMIARLEADGA